MTTYDEIEQAITAHEKWVKHINMTVALSGYEPKLSVQQKAENNALIAKVSQGDNCPLGKWLHSVTDTKIVNSPYYNKVMVLHDLFHQEAADILMLTFSGENIKAKKLLAEHSDFSQNSLALVAVLKAWQQTLY